MTMDKYSILIVDDEPNYLVVLSELLKEEGFEVFTAPGGKEGLEIVRNVDLDIVITDMQMPGMDGLQFMLKIKEEKKDLPVIVVTAYAEVDKAVEAMQSGAFSYLAKPFSNDELVVNLRKAGQHYALIRENTRLRDELKGKDGFSGLVGKNPKMVDAYQLIEKVSSTHASVLITGESGTGKELVARAIHRNSRRESQPFIAVNCANLSEELLESELFGHEKGAITGAVTMRKGQFEVAHGGTIFLGEVGEISLSVQTKLLRVLQENKIVRVGGGKTVDVDVRILSGSSHDLREDVLAGKFREELFFKLNVIPVSLPALRERMDDMKLLADYFVEKFKIVLEKTNLTMSAEAFRLLMKLPWDGNIRELENTIERAAILCSEDVIEAEDIQPDPLYSREESQWGQDMDLRQLIPENAGLTDVLYTIEEKMLVSALADTDNVQARAADKLGITKSLLQYKMKKYGIKKKK